MMRNLYYYLTRLIKDSLFHTFSVTVAIWDNFMGLNYKPAEGTYNVKDNKMSDVTIKTKDIL